MANFDIIEGSALEVLACMEDGCVNNCVTSPPYWKQRDYGHEGQLGQEKTPAEFVANLAAVFGEVYRVLKAEGSCWVNIDDTYHRKELCGIPWMLVAAMKQKGWKLRAEVIWHKTSSIPESAKNRVSRVHEYLFHFVKNVDDYYYDGESIREPHTNPWAIDCIKKYLANPVARRKDYNPFSKEERKANKQQGITRSDYGAMMNPNGKNKRTMWYDTRYLRIKRKLQPFLRTALFGMFNSEIVFETDVPDDLKGYFEALPLEYTSVLTLNNKEKFEGAHYAVFPQGLIVPCVLSTCPAGGLVLDPFTGAGTTGVVALKHDRNFIGIELVQANVELSAARMAGISKKLSEAQKMQVPDNQYDSSAQP